MKFNYIILLVLIASFVSIIYGFNLKTENEPVAHKYIGFGTAGLFLVAMPLFLYKESKKGKQMKDYMLTKENIEKMQRKEREKTDNQ